MKHGCLYLSIEGIILTFGKTKSQELMLANNNTYINARGLILYKEIKNTFFKVFSNSALNA